MGNEGLQYKIDSLIQLVKEYDPDADTSMILDAYELAKGAHEGQKRMSGEDYIIHPVSVAFILAEYKMDVETIVAAILHDVIEDTVYTYEDITTRFNEQVADLVEGVTKITRIDYQSKEESQAENLRKMVLAMSKDIRVIIIKLVDRLHNMRTLEYMRESKQIEKSRETLDIYAPIANRLGIQTIKGELENLSLKYLDPDAYYDLVKKVKAKRNVREDYIEKVIVILKKEIEDVGIEAKIYGRSKHFYSIYKKMKNQNRDFEEIYDLIAVRVIVDSVKDCYGVLGVIHTQWKPIPGRFKDYIAMPKPNMYQSIHTTVIGPGGDPFEIQIRTKEMHEVAEYGIAAHWKYKEGKGAGGNRKEQKYETRMAWLRQILEWQKELDNDVTLAETIKEDLLNDEVYVFTPKGKVLELPVGSCPLDFAYRIHSDIGNTCVGAKVNGKIVPLNYELANGDIVEIMTSKNANGPSRDWLSFVKSATARNKIRQYFKKEEKDENIIKGKSLLEHEIRREGLADTKLLSHSEVQVVGEKMGYKNLDDFYAAVGYGGVKLGNVLTKMRLLFPGEFPEEKDEVIVKKRQGDKKPKGNIIVAGYNEIDVRYAKCCNPVPGDKIVGYITVGRGISIHRTDCPNILNLQDPNRLVNVEWNIHAVGGAFPVEVHIRAYETKGLLIKVNQVFIDLNIDLYDIHGRKEDDATDFVSVNFDVKSKRELNLLLKELNKIPEVISVLRI